MIDQQTRQLALRGEYLPQGKGDEYYSIFDGKVASANAFGSTDSYIKRRSEGEVFFPDEQTCVEWNDARPAEQRSAFIAKRKGEELRPAHDFTVLMGGGDATSEQTRKLTPDELTRKANVPKPQTITICISDEAIERTALSLYDQNGGYRKDDQPKVYDKEKAIVRAIVGMLHLEATLS